MFSFKRHIETDEEFVCKIRKRIKNRRKVAILALVMAFILLVCELWFLFLVFGMIENSGPEKGVIWAGFFAGIMCGLLFSVFAVQIIYYIVEAMIGFEGKRDRLLIKYYDALISPTKAKTDNTENDKE